MTYFTNLITGSWPGEEWSFTVHTQGPSGTAAANAALVTAADILWNTGDTTGLRGYVPSTSYMLEASTAALDALTGKQIDRIIHDYGATRPGTAAGEALPPQLAIACSLRTASATRAGRGRFYLPAFTVAEVDGGRVAAAVVTHVSLVCKAFLDSLAASGYQPVVYHRSLKTSDNVTRIDVGDVYDTQRRRRNKLIETRTSQTL